MSEPPTGPSDDNLPTQIVPTPRSESSPFPVGMMLSADLSKTQTYAQNLAPTHLGRYSIEGYLGHGGFGVVYRARDDELQRLVAIKVPHASRVSSDSDRRLYLAEARMLALLDHPGVVQIYDYGVMADNRCFVVSKLIDGQNLAQRIANEHPSLQECLAMLISLAETLQYIHDQKLIHRDIKPSNLLIDSHSRVYVTDFGLALHEADLEAHQAGAGTPNYMSPEQAGGEGHRIDYRTDLFSLGAVMYELLTGTRPFQGTSFDETRRKLISIDPVPVNVQNPAIPAEMNRICLKLLAKRASDRYSSGRELAADLRHFQAVCTRSGDETVLTSLPSGTPELMSGKFIPRGLRPYDRHDAYFFLQLLPGPFGRDGLPESLSHWEHWVENPEEPAELYRIGVIAGPSGCGKSSLIRAGLIPRLDRNMVTTLIVEATVDRTESQLSSLIDSRFPLLEREKALTEKLTAIRRGQGFDPDKKLLIVIDQFEQWLHSVHEREDQDLIRALRQCDGKRIQCIVLVRDDFWMALNRFMLAVEAPLAGNENVRLVDLFDRPHAEKVLAKLGQAFERIPEGPLDASANRFIRMAVEYLSKEGKVFPVHLSLFAEMVKSRDWVPDTLSELGGAVGVGVQFLRESFSAAHAPMSYRIHEGGVRRVMEGLLPDSGTQIKTRHRTLKEMAELSGYGDDTERFEGLMSILEGQLKLISPVDVLDHSRSSAETRNVELHYQLSHDFLVPSIREWLYSEQRKTYAGRCRLLLAEQAVAWNKQPIRRNLPLWRDWIQYRCLLRPSTLTEPERRLLTAANQQLGLQTIMGILALGFVLWGVQAFRSWNRAHSLLAQLRTTHIDATPAIVDELASHPQFARGLVGEALGAAQPGSEEEANLRLAELRWDESAVEPLLERSLNSGDPQSLMVIREALSRYREKCVGPCWKELSAGAAAGPQSEIRLRGFRAAFLLAELDPPQTESSQQRWAPFTEYLSEETTNWALRNPDAYRSLVEGMRPVAKLLTPMFSKSLGDTDIDDRSRSNISFLKAFYENDDEELTRLLIQGSPWQWDDLRPAIKSISLVKLRAVLETPRDTSSLDSEIRWERQISAAGALLLSLSPREETWSLLQRDSNPGVRSHLIDRMAPLGVKLTAVEDRLTQEVARTENADDGILNGLLLTMGQYADAKDQLREATQQQIRILFETHPDAGVHSAADWLMRRCAIPQNIPLVTTSGVSGKPGVQWRLTPEGHLMVRFDARTDPEIGRIFEICATEVTVKQYQEFSPYKYYSTRRATTTDCPLNIVKWPEALVYCNWLTARHGLPPDQFCCPPGDPNETPDQQAERLYGWGPDDDTSYYQRRGYRIPTRAEWAFACRAGTQTRWHFGNDLILVPRYAWHIENSIRPTDLTISISSPVGQLLPNDYGLFDMYGNVMEWAADSKQDGSSRNQRYAMGGAHTNLAELMETASTRLTPTNTEFESLGFRIARTVGESESVDP